MTTYIFNTAGDCVSESHNLRGLFNWARRAGGVKALECHTFPATDASYPLSKGDPREKWVKASRPTGYLVARLANGYRAETWFTSGSHLVEWAHDRAKPHRNSWFSGAVVEVNSHDAWMNIFDQSRQEN